MNDKYIIDELFDDATTQIEALKWDIYEFDGNYHIEIDVPGFNKQSLKVEYINGYISVIGNRQPDANVKYIKKERFYGTYKREFYVGEVDVLRVNAKYRDGILSIVVPKSIKESPKTITIK